ncbi:hypothetical protein BYT27DRAFT_7255617 [Phlegmacium glaucopus]|nr:hypothetical protein BYT27DRAFT_7255617 [Phlegmacium glaucopus]
MSSTMPDLKDWSPLTSNRKLQCKFHSESLLERPGSRWQLPPTLQNCFYKATSLGEIEGITEAFQSSHGPENPLLIGAAKSCVGLVPLTPDHMNPSIQCSVVPLQYSQRNCGIEEIKSWSSACHDSGFAKSIAGAVLEAPSEEHTGFRPDDGCYTRFPLRPHPFEAAISGIICYFQVEWTRLLDLWILSARCPSTQFSALASCTTANAIRQWPTNRDRRPFLPHTTLMPEGRMRAILSSIQSATPVDVAREHYRYTFACFAINMQDLIPCSSHYGGILRTGLSISISRHRSLSGPAILRLQRYHNRCPPTKHLR